ncbi:MAG TPA: type II toxin-antitoxin system VapC family toxin [Anaerolineae bacterium]|nr:type II toxin-antitoxin system VapC family toxin [Anaerolineae bacterium]
MILYLDTSALVKQLVTEVGSSTVDRFVATAQTVGTSIITRAEVAAALAKVVRVGGLRRDEASTTLASFRSHWSTLVRLQVTEALIAKADALAWEHNLRGYDAVHLASALFWQESLGEPVTLATLDVQLWRAGLPVGLSVWPEDLERFTR